MSVKKHKILIVDDSPSIRLFLNVSLSSTYEVMEVGSIKGAIEIYEEKKPDLVILDLGLSDGDGFEVLSHIRQKDKDVAVIVLTIRNDSETRMMSENLGANEYIIKPFHFNDVNDAIKKLLEGKL